MDEQVNLHALQSLGNPLPCLVLRTIRCINILACLHKFCAPESESEIASLHFMCMQIPCNGICFVAVSMIAFEVLSTCMTPEKYTISSLFACDSRWQKNSHFVIGKLGHSLKVAMATLHITPVGPIVGSDV
jgi:hypothetical protein